MSRRNHFRIAIVLSLAGAALAGGFPSARGSAVPATMMRTVGVPSRSMLPRAAGPSLALAPGGGLRAVTPATTAHVPVCAPIWFTSVAVTWNQVTGGAVETRIATSADGLAYGGAVDADTDDSPDTGSPDWRGHLQGSALVWTGGSRCLRFSMRLPRGAAISNVRAIFINTSGTSAGPGTAPPDAGVVAADPSGPFGLPAAEAMTTQPTLITRERWGADPSLLNCDPYYAPAVKMAFVHHTAGTNTYKRWQSDDVVRGIYAYHTNGRGWCDIAYNFLVDRFGRVFEGRAGGPTLPVIGAATQGFNTGSFSVSLMGNFDTVHPQEVALQSLENILAWRLDVAHVPARGKATMVSAGGDNTRYPAGTVTRLLAVSGHRQTGYTDCPGTHLYRLLPDIRHAVAGIGLPKIYRPKLSTGEIVAGIGGDIRIRAGATEPLAWSVTVLDAGGAVAATLPAPAGMSLDLVWSPLGPPPQPSVPGDYLVVITGQTTGGRVALSASLALTVLPAPSPSPSV